MWKIIKFKDTLIPWPSEDLFCPFCGSKLWLHDFFVRKYDSRGQRFYHVDVHMKCPECSFYATFGVPLSVEDYERLRTSSFEGRVLINEIKELYRDEDDHVKLAERLRRWGYW